MSKYDIVSDIPGNRHYVFKYREIICCCSDLDNARMIADALNKILI